MRSTKKRDNFKTFNALINIFLFTVCLMLGVVFVFVLVACLVFVSAVCLAFVFSLVLVEFVFVRFWLIFSWFALFR